MTHNKQEIWKDIEEFKGFYQISSHARVKSVERYIERKNNKGKQYIPERIIKQRENIHGYMVVNLWKNNKGYNRQVHRLVIEAFVPKIDGKDLTNHIDANKKNNFPENLEWCNHSENLIHAYEKGLNKKCIKTKVINLKTGEENTFKSMGDASRFMGKSNAYVSNLIKKLSLYKNKEYRWEVI